MFDALSFKKPLDSKLHSRYVEQLVFSMLKHIFPETSSILTLSDSPDLQVSAHLPLPEDGEQRWR